MTEPTAFLYPFIDHSPIEGSERHAGVLLADLAASAQAKAVASAELQAATLAAVGDELTAVAVVMAERFVAGGRLFTFGNGGSSTDAAAVTALFATPPWGEALASRSLVEDTAVLTALGNDVGFDLVFARQLIAHAGAGDMALGLSTSGSSRNVLTAFAEAARRGLVTIGVAGYDGGDMARDRDVHHCLVVGSDSVHRVQEVQAALLYALWADIQTRMAGRHHG